MTERRTKAKKKVPRTRTKDDKIPWQRAAEPSLVTTKDGKTYSRFQRTVVDITPEQMKRLEEAWSYEWTDVEAVDYAGITYKILRAHYERDPSLMNKRDLLRNTPILYAKKNITDSVKAGDLGTSRWLLERRVKEYAQRNQLDVQVKHSLSIEQIEAKLTALVGQGNREMIEHAIEQVEQYHDVIDVESEPVAADEEDGADGLDLDSLLS